MSETATTWPEQEAVIRWTEKHDISMPEGAFHELCKSVTAYRIQCQREAEATKGVLRQIRHMCGDALADDE
jgi:hypothetical protein